MLVKNSVNTGCNTYFGLSKLVCRIMRVGEIINFHLGKEGKEKRVDIGSLRRLGCKS